MVPKLREVEERLNGFLFNIGSTATGLYPSTRFKGSCARRWQHEIVFDCYFYWSRGYSLGFVRRRVMQAHPAFIVYCH
jgi:hypothetical protein